MRLLLDVGNTRLKWGLRTEGRWLSQGALDLADLEFLGEVLAEAPTLESVAGVNVAGSEVARRIGVALGHGLTPRWLGATAAAAGVENRYGTPERLGADRWAALVGAWGIQGGACLVVTAGTATTVDVLDGAGVFQGGVILPGFDLMRRSLARDTAGLPYAEGRFQALPRDTANAIHTGCLLAQAGAVERMFQALADQPGAVCLLNGGAAAILKPALGLPLREVPNLVLEGVARLVEWQEGRPRDAG
ncbi:MAG: type III pantothenate kinase [Rhodocyclaceae bacterium]|jgi:type III pantothenate kinase|nr:type III pantothenate kinase [Rhodocyclaceae bacterium]